MGAKPRHGRLEQRKVSHRNLQALQEDVAIATLCEVLSHLEGQSVSVSARPDRGGTGNCDALLLRGGTVWAAEHTRIYGIADRPGLLRQTARLRGAVEPAVAAACPDRRLTVHVTVPAVGLLGDPERLGKSIADHCAAIGPTLEPDELRILTDCALSVPVAVRRERFERPPGCSVLAQDPPSYRDQTLRNLAERIQRKCEAMRHWRAKGMPTLLILDAPHSLHPSDEPRDFGPLVAEALVGTRFREVYLCASAIGRPRFWPMQAASNYPASGHFIDAFLSAQAEAAVP
jgi:hypothetical protein